MDLFQLNLPKSATIRSYCAPSWAIVVFLWMTRGKKFVRFCCRIGWEFPNDAKCQGLSSTKYCLTKGSTQADWGTVQDPSNLLVGHSASRVGSKRIFAVNFVRQIRHPLIRNYFRRLQRHWSLLQQHICSTLCLLLLQWARKPEFRALSSLGQGGDPLRQACQFSFSFLVQSCPDHLFRRKRILIAPQERPWSL